LIRAEVTVSHDCVFRFDDFVAALAQAFAL
jgi:hypothetical protein